MAAPVEQELRRAVADLDALGVRWALVDGLATSVRSVPRFTKDLDFAVAVANDSEAEDVVLRLCGRGYQPVEVLEQDYVERLSGVRLERTGSDVIVDLLFASSGIEDEVVANATRLQVLPRLSAPVATTGHLIALKILRAGRAGGSEADAAGCAPSQGCAQGRGYASRGSRGRLRQAGGGAWSGTRTWYVYGTVILYQRGRSVPQWQSVPARPARACSLFFSRSMTITCR